MFDFFLDLFLGAAAGYGIRGFISHRGHSGRRCALRFATPLAEGSYSANGTARKLMDSNRLAARNWKPELALEDGVDSASSLEALLNRPFSRDIGPINCGGE
jgi:hypothetical protein